MAKSDLADSILENAEPLVARELVTLTLGSDDPDDHRKFLELMAKRRAKDGPSAGATFHFTFDMGAGAITLAEQPSPQPEVIDVEAKPALPSPENADDLRLADQAAEPALPADLAELLGMDLTQIQGDPQ